jgi:energy-coupling factor transporter ATP-binding protein EcfA2
MTPSSDAQRLVILTGPVGGGKSTVAQALAALLRRPSRKVAVFDLDVIYDMFRQREGYTEPELWPLARQASGALAAAALQHGFHGVVIEGEYFTPEHLEQVAGASALPPPAVFVLNVPYGETLRRVGLDDSRGASKNPVLLRQFHTAFTVALPFLDTAATVLNAEHAPPAELAAEILARLTAHRGAHRAVLPRSE